MSEKNFVGHQAQVNDITMHYLRAGEGPPVLLLHGWPEFCLTWRKNIPELARSFDVVAPDLRGFGATSKPEGVPEVRIYAEDVLALADQLWPGRKISIVSHDVGAFVAQTAARENPGRIDRLFFFNCPHLGIGDLWIRKGQFREIWYQSFHQLDWAADLVGSSREACAVYFRHFLSHWSADAHAFDEDFEAWIDNFMQPGALQGGFNWYRAVDAERRRAIEEGPPELAPIAAPSYALWGRQDPVLRAEWAEGLRDWFSEIEIEIAEDAGHFVHYERPELANARIATFFGASAGLPEAG